MSYFLRATIAAPLAVLSLTPVNAQETTAEAEAYTIAIETVADGLNHPWALAFVSDAQFLVTERNPGTLRSGTIDGTLSDPLWEAGDLFRYEGDTPRSQAGLFDVRLHPEFDENGWVSLARPTMARRSA